MKNETEILTIKQADELIESLANRESQLAAMAAQIDARLAEAESSAGDRFLDAGCDFSAAPPDEVATLRHQSATLNAGLAAIARRKPEALLARRRAEATEARSMAESKKSELAALEEQTGKLLAALSKIEGVEFQSGILSNQPDISSGWTQIDFRTPPQPWQSDRELKSNGGTASYCVPRSRKLRQEIADLETQALVIERELGIAA